MRTTTVEEKIRQFTELAATLATEHYRGTLEHMSPKCESPIELLFLAAFIIEVRQDRCNELDIPFHFLKHFTGSKTEGYWPEGASVYCQVELGNYRADFYIELIRGHRTFRLAIECDGHDFHERTKEQARRDRGRDRWLQAQGITILRFTGAEIWEDSSRCAEEVVALLQNKWVDI